jgi:hypothetical protein
VVGVLGLRLLHFLIDYIYLLKKKKKGVVGETKDQVRKRELVYATTYFKSNE